MPTEESLESLYEDTYRTTENPIVEEIQKESRRARRQLEFLQATQDWGDDQYKPRGIPRTVLDVGSSTGQFGGLLAMMGSQAVIGVEPGKWREWSDRYLHKTYESVEDVPARLRFDLVSASHVLEHVSDPVNFILQLRRFVDPDGGRLMIAVPDLHRPVQSVFSTPHLYVFTRRTLDTLLSLAGFEIVEKIKSGPDLTVIAKLGEPKWKIRKPAPFLSAKVKLFRRLYENNAFFGYWSSGSYGSLSYKSSFRIFTKISYVLRQWYILLRGVYTGSLFLLRYLFSRTQLGFNRRFGRKD